MKKLMGRSPRLKKILADGIYNRREHSEEVGRVETAWVLTRPARIPDNRYLLESP